MDSLIVGVIFIVALIIGFILGERSCDCDPITVSPPKTRIQKCDILFVEPCGTFKDEELKRVQSEVYEMMIAGCVVIPNGFSYTIRDVDMLVVEDETVL